jgi:hypothetical protein
MRPARSDQNRPDNRLAEGRATAAKIGPPDSRCIFRHFAPERNPGSRVVSWVGQLHEESAMPDNRIKFRSESVMGGLYLGIVVTSVNALVAMALVIAFISAGLF